MQSMTLILVCQLAGEGLTRWLGLAVPGPVVGMVLMFLGLLIHGSVPSDLSRTAGLLLGNLSLLFVPAGVGVVTHLTLIGSEGLSISVALVISTVVAIAVTAWLMNRMAPADAEQGSAKTLSVDSRGDH